MKRHTPKQTPLERATAAGAKAGAAAAARFVAEADRDDSLIVQIVPRLQRTIEQRVQMLARAGYSREQCLAWAHAFISAGEPIVDPFLERRTAEVDTELAERGAALGIGDSTVHEPRHR